MIARRIFLAALVLTTGCSVFDSPFRATSAGIATRDASDSFVASALEQKRALHSRAMHDAICAAGADTAECRQ